MKLKHELHAQGPQEHALCGLAFDAFDSNDHHEPVAFAKLGETVTCPMCRAHLDHIRLAFNKYKAIKN